MSKRCGKNSKAEPLQAPTHIDRVLERLQALNRLVYELNRRGRGAGLHSRVPWRERITAVPPDAVPLTPEEIAARGWHVGPLLPEPGEPAAAAEMREAEPRYRTRKPARTANPRRKGTRKP